MMEIETESTEREVIAQVKSLAEAAFFQHVLKQEESNTWLCSRPGTGKYSFRVTFCPCYVMLYGDISPQMLFHRFDSSLGVRWLLTNAAHADDLFVGAKIMAEAFFVKDVLATCAEEERAAMANEELDVSLQWQMLATRFRHNMAQGEDPREAWLYASHAIFHEAKDGMGVGYGSDMLWQQQALLTFVRLYQQRQTELPVSRL